MTDISSFMTTFLSGVIDLFSSAYGYLSDISFGGISLLSYTIALFVLSVAIPIVVSVIRGGYSTSRGYYRRSHRSGGSHNED